MQIPAQVGNVLLVSTPIASLPHSLLLWKGIIIVEDSCYVIAANIYTHTAGEKRNRVV